MDHDRRNDRTPATRRATDFMPVAVSPSKHVGAGQSAPSPLRCPTWPRPWMAAAGQGGCRGSSPTPGRTDGWQSSPWRPRQPSHCSRSPRPWRSGTWSTWCWPSRGAASGRGSACWWSSPCSTSGRPSSAALLGPPGLLDVQFDMRNDLAAALSRLDGAGQDRLQTGQVVSRSISDVTLCRGCWSFRCLTGNALLFVVSLSSWRSCPPLLTVVALAVGRRCGGWACARGATCSRRTGPPSSRPARSPATSRPPSPACAWSRASARRTASSTGSTVGARRLFGARMRVVRFTARYNPLLQAVPALGQVGRAGAGRLAGAARRDHPRHVPGLRHLPRRAGLARCASWPPCSPSGQQARAGVERVLRDHRRPAGAHRRSRRRAAAGRPADGRARRRHLRPHDDRPVLSGCRCGSSRARPSRSSAPPARASPASSLLLPRFYDLGSGRGADRRRRRPRPGARALRARSGVVFEDSFLFSDSVAANIAFGRPGRHRRGGARPPPAPRRPTASSRAARRATTPSSASRA